MARKWERTTVIAVDVPPDGEPQHEVTFVLEHEDGKLQYMAVPIRAITHKINVRKEKPHAR